MHKLPRELSDHNPLILTSSQKQSMRKLTFRFELVWLKDPQFLPLVQEIWAKLCHAETTFDRIQAKLKRFKQFFKGWGFNRQGEQRKIKLELQEEPLVLEQLEEEQVLNLNQIQRKMMIQKNILDILGEEECRYPATGLPTPTVPRLAQLSVTTP